MVHKITEKLNRSYIVVERTDFSARKQRKPLFEVIPTDVTDMRKLKSIARKLSGDVSDVAIVFDSTSALYKGGERRI
jgi:hypothetical protein